jgi:hypothetical protein
MLANPARGFEPEDSIFEYGLMATTGTDWREAWLSAFAQSRASLWPGDVARAPVATAEGPPGCPVRVCAVKAADRGVGLVVRLVAAWPPGTEVRVTLPGRALRAAWLCDARERDISELPVKDGRVRVLMEGTIASVRLVVQGA